MRLDDVRANLANPNETGHMGSPRRARATGVGLLERDDDARELPPLPALGAGDASGVSEQSDELAEFIEFFTGPHTAIKPSVEAPTKPIAAQPRAPQSRVRRATERVMRVATMRPVAQLPRIAPLPRAAFSLRARVIDAAALSSDLDDEVSDEVATEAPARRTIKLPPVWVMVNIAIVAAMLLGFAPQIITASAAAGCKWYRVQPGDTLWNLSKSSGVSISQLASANHIQNINLIYVDQEMCIPLMPLASSNQPAPAPASHAPIYSAPANVRAFVSYTLPYAQKASRATGWPVSMILAQWGLETGWRIKTFTGYNWGNCGAMPGEPMTSGTSAPGSPAAFAYAYTPEQGVAEYVHVAQLGYYRHVAQAASNGADAAARALGQSPWDWGHYTNRGDPGSSIITIMRVFNLYYYDTHSN